MVLVCFQVNDEVACLLDFRTASRWTVTGLDSADSLTYGGMQSSEH